MHISDFCIFLQEKTNNNSYHKYEKVDRNCQKSQIFKKWYGVAIHVLDKECEIPDSIN